MIFSEALKQRGIPLTTRPDTSGRGRQIFKGGLKIDEGYAAATLARRDGHKIALRISEYNAATICMTVYASAHERFYLKIYAANGEQASSALEELSAIGLGGDPQQKELDL